MVERTKVTQLMRMVPQTLSTPQLGACPVAGAQARLVVAKVALRLMAEKRS